MSDNKYDIQNVEKKSWIDWWDTNSSTIVETGTVVLGAVIMVGGAWFVYKKYFRE